MSYDDDYGIGGLIAVWLVLAPLLFILAIAAYVISSWFLMKLFEKAGVQGKWRAWVPVYNTLIFVKLGDLNPSWLLILWGATAFLSWIPVVGQLFGLAAFIYTLLAAWRVGLKLLRSGNRRPDRRSDRPSAGRLCNFSARKLPNSGAVQQNPIQCCLRFTALPGFLLASFAAQRLVAFSSNPV